MPDHIGWYVRVKFKHQPIEGPDSGWNYKICITHPPFPSLHAAAEYARRLPDVKEWDIRERILPEEEYQKERIIQEFFAACEEEDGL